MGIVTIGGDIRGADLAAGSLVGSAVINGDRIASVTVGGSIIAGQDNSAGGSIIYSASIAAVKDIGSLTVKGSLLGSVGSGGDITKVIITAGGQPVPTPTTDLAIGKVTIGGRVERAQILAGYNLSLAPTNGNAQVGAVSVSGDWIASDLIAGVADGGAFGFGDAGDLAGPAASGIAKIASITIGGRVAGTVAGGDQFGFESHKIGSFTVGGVPIPIVSPVVLSAATGSDVTIRLI
jgi:hypothetical protein